MGRTQGRGELSRMKTSDGRENGTRVGKVPRRLTLTSCFWNTLEGAFFSWKVLIVLSLHLPQTLSWVRDEEGGRDGTQKAG